MKFRLIAIIGATIAAFAVVAQFYLILLNREVAVGETIIRFFSYFTILTNTWVAGTFIYLAVKVPDLSNQPRATFWTPLAVFILTVGLVYQFLLRSLWSPEGLQMVVDELLHTIIPLYYLIFWWLYGPHPTISWRRFFPWLLYPVLYLSLVLVRGYFSDFYPYPFLDLTQISGGQLVANSIILMGVFLLLAALLIGIDHYWRKWKTKI